MTELPPGYRLALEQITQAFDQWMREHPNALLRFRFPPAGVVVIAPLCADTIERLSGTEDARLVLEYMDAASNHQATVLMVVAMLKERGEFKDVVVRKVAEFACPYCGRRLNAVANQSGENTLPTPGSFSLCDQCTEIGVFKEDGSLRKITPLELQEIDRETLEDITKYRANLKASRGRPTS